MKHTLTIFYHILFLFNVYLCGVGGDVETESTGVQGSPIQGEKQESLNTVRELTSDVVARTRAHTHTTYTQHTHI